jgi:TolB-like protein
MTSSRSNTSRSSCLALLAVLVVWTGIAHAGGRKRVVVLDFEGPKAEKFHDDIVKLIKKSHTVVATDKWNGTAEELKLDSAKVNEKNVKKIARKLKVDGVVTGKIEKRDDQYIVQLKLRAGKSGALVGERIDTKSDSAKLDSKAKKDVTDELVAAIEELEANHGDEAGDDDGGPAMPADEPKVKKKDVDPPPAAGDDDDDTKHHGFSKKKDLDATAETAVDDPPHKHHKKDVATTDDPAPKASDDPPPDTGHHHKKKHSASAGDDDGSTSVSEQVDTPAVVALTGDAALTPANRAVDFTIGMSFTARHLSYKTTPMLSLVPPEYKEGLPVPGGVMDATVYPFAITHKNTGMLANLGIEVMYDKVIVISSKKPYIDTSMNQQTATLNTVEDHFSVGAVFRYPLGPAVVGAKLMYMTQQFNIEQVLPNGSPTDVPDVQYAAIEPKAFVKYTVLPGLIANAEGGFMLVTKTGDISQDGMTGYGGSKDTGFELTAGVDYNLTKAIFARAYVHLEEIKLTFKGDANSLSNTRDSDPTTQDVLGATDLYWGGAVAIGYAY